jgi:tripartite-type tricarboxylate transporter receptor subunit TctC
VAVRILASLLVLAAWSGTAIAQDAVRDWPVRTVRILIPLGAGGGGDIFARLLAEELQKKFGQPFVVENRPGGGLNIGARACAEAVPDGYTLCVMSSEPVVFNQFLYRSLPFDPEKDFEPITNLFINSVALVANAKLNVRTIPEMVALAKAKPGTLSYGTFSFVLVQYMEKLKKQEGIDIVRVPFRSGNEVVNAIMAGSTPIAFLGLANMLPQIRAGLITPIALNAYQRSPLFPDLPTLKEATGEDVPPTWFGLFAPAGTPKPVIEKVHAEVVRITSDPAWRQKNFIDRAIEPAVGGTAEFARFVAESRKRAAVIVKDSGLTLH